MGFFTRHKEPQKEQPCGKPRGCLPDAVSQDAFILIKSGSELRLTYEIRLATFMAQQSRKKLRLILQPSTVASAQLRAFAAKHGVSIEESKT
jgi:hypothetical protein